MGSVPERIKWAVELIDPRPGERILEVGCGPGAAAELICDRLANGWLLATDRSPVAVARTAARNQTHVEAGRLTVRQAALDALELAADDFDKAFSINVNVFWTSPAERELATLHHTLRPGGHLFILYGQGPTGTDRITPTISTALHKAGFTTITPITTTPGLGITAQVPHLPPA